MKSRENWLVNQLDIGILTDEVRAAYEAELDEIAAKITVQAERNKELQAQERMRRAEIRARILANDIDLIQTLGEEEFQHDYEIITEGPEFVVYSKVARDNQESRRPHLTMDAAVADLRTLYSHRLYNKYLRDSDLVDLSEIA